MASSTQFARAAAWAAALLVATASGAAAQAPPNDGQAPKPAPATPDGGNAAGTLSQQLNRSNGVITPPKDIDPKMSAPVPNAHPHTTPVIPPPGTPGGKPGVEPK